MLLNKIAVPNSAQFFAGKYDRIKREWLKRTSSRFWRGPMAQRFWVCTDKNLGRWRPKAADETEKNRRSGKRKKISGQRPLKARREPVGHGQSTSMHQPSPSGVLLLSAS